MTARTMWTRLAATLAAVALIVAVVPAAIIIVIARAVGLVAAVALVFWYHRNAHWQGSSIGRGTMAIKAGVVAIALAANINTINRHAQVDLTAVAHRSLAAAWLLMATALVFRLVVMRRIQDEGGHLSARLREKERP